MATQTYSDGRYIPASSLEEPTFTLHGGGMFAGSHHFTIGGGMFNNTTSHYYQMAPAKPTNFPMIPMGEIHLQQERMVILHSDVVIRWHAKSGVRRVYSAKIVGRNTDLTVAMYEGDGAEEAWRRDVELYMSLRHPNIAQMYGMANSGALYATIFHDDLIPFKQFVASASPVMTVYSYACYVGEWAQVCRYVGESQHICKSVKMDFMSHSAVSIHRSNGRLCADLIPQLDLENRAHYFFHWLSPLRSHAPINPSLEATSQEAAAIDSLTLEEYYFICRFSLSRVRFISVSSSATISSGAIFCLRSKAPLEEGDEIASLEETTFHGWGWVLEEKTARVKLVENGWTRLDAMDVCNGKLVCTLWSVVGAVGAWLPQANYIFSCLQITANFEDYLAIRQVDFNILIRDATQTPGYLFLCPNKDFRAGPTSLRWPDCPAYWSLDPLGVDRLSMEEATRLGFPALQPSTKIHGVSWDASVYAGLRQFHQAKGFDPNSQNIALRLGLPLFRLSGDSNPLFTHVGELSKDDDHWFDDDTDEEHTSEDSETEKSSSNADDANKADERRSVGDLDLEENGEIEAGGHPEDAPRDGEPEVYKPSCLRSVHMSHCEDPTPHSVDLEANLEPQIHNDRASGRGFIHRIIGGLPQGLVMETANIDSYTISPFLV